MLKSLEIVNKALKDSIVLGNVINFCGVELSRNEANQIKQDLEKHSNVMKLLKNLFDGIRLDGEDVYDGNTYCYSSYIMEDLDYNTFEISNELFNILDDLKNLVGDNHD